MAALVAGLAISGCAASPPTADGPSMSHTAVSGNLAQRELTPDEKKVIVEAIAPSLRNPASAKYRWAKLPTDVPTDGSVNYCGTVDAKSPYPAYDGRQAFIVEARLVGGKVSAASMELIAGGKDVAIVAKACAKYGLDPNSAS